MTKQRAEPEEVTTSTKTCFVMMPISDVDDYPAGHFGEVFKQLIEPAVVAAGYQCTLATSTSAAHMIQLEVITKVATADLCICDLSNNNPNVLFEYGIRQAFDKPTVLIKDDKTRRIFDLSGFRDIEYDHTLRIANTLAARDQITKAIADTVNGVGDDEQVFSLVKLMKLTKAALPTGEVSKDDARFELLERKLDRVLSMQANTREVLRNLPKAGSVRGIQEHIRAGQYRFSFADGSVKISNESTGEVEVFSDIFEFDRNLSLKNIHSEAKKQIEKKAETYLIPF